MEVFQLLVQLLRAYAPELEEDADGRITHITLTIPVAHIDLNTLHLQPIVDDADPRPSRARTGSD